MEQSVHGVFAPTLRDPTPSPEDVAVTRAMVEAGRLLNVEVLDHVILSSNGYVSLKAKGIGF